MIRPPEKCYPAWCWRICKSVGRVLREVTLSRIVAVLVVSGLVVVVIETFRETVIVEPFAVPQQIAELGYTPRVVAQHFIDNVHAIHKAADLAMGIEIAGTWERSELDLEISTTAVTIKSMAAHLRALLPIERTVISGELVPSASTGAIFLRVRANGRLVMDTFEKCAYSSASGSEEVSRFFVDGAAKVLAATDPYTLATYYYHVLSQYPYRSRAHDHYRANLDRLMALIFEGRSVDTDTKYRSTVLRGNLLLKHKRQLEEAISTYDEAVQMAPHRALAYLNRAVAYKKQKDTRRATWNVMKALERDSDFGAAAYTIWGEIVYNEAGRASQFDASSYIRAIEMYGEAIERDPGYARAYLGRGLAYYQLYKVLDDGYGDKAAADYQQAIENDPDYGEACAAFGELLRSQERYQEAIEQYKRAIELMPYHPWAYEKWSEALGKLAGEHDAEARLRERAQGEVARGNALAKAGDCSGAKERYRDAMKLDGKYRHFDCEALGGGVWDARGCEIRIGGLVTEN